MIHVIVGPPCAGKSTYLQEHASDGDLRIDFDAIAEALGSTTSHDAPDHIRSAAFAARDAAITHALNHPADDSWIIHTSPTPAQIDEYKAAEATFHLLDPGKDTCLQRADTDARPTHTTETINTWYATPPAIPQPTTPKSRQQLITELLNIRAHQQGEGASKSLTG